jgi:hypothetical protein
LADLDQRKTTSIKSRTRAEGAGRKLSRVNVAYGKNSRKRPVLPQPHARPAAVLGDELDALAKIAP